LQDALRCVDEHRNSDESFGDLTAGINLWWGEKWTAHLTNLGFVIGLRNDEAGQWWRLDYDEKKGAHINQGNLIGSGSWAKVYHPIKFGYVNPEAIPSYSEEYWVREWWTRWTRLSESKAPANVAEKMKRFGVSFK